MSRRTGGSPVFQCVLCLKGETRPGVTTLTVERDRATIVITEIPAEVCRNCGEAYLGEAVLADVERIEEAVRAGVEVDVRRYAA